MELVTLVHFTGTELAALGNDTRRVHFRRLGRVAGIALSRQILIICLAALDLPRGSVDISVLGLLLLRYFSVVVIWVADVEN